MSDLRCPSCDADLTHCAACGTTFDPWEADHRTAVSTVGDLTARHIGQTIKYGNGDDIGRSGVYGGMVSAYPDSGRCALWVGGGYEAGVPFDTPCRLVGGGDHATQ